MKPIFSHKSATDTQCARGEPGSPIDNRIPADTGEFYACCCPAKPIVRVTMPPSPVRPHSVDLLLCGHHYRVSRAQLEAAGATTEELPGHAADVAAALFQEFKPPVVAADTGPTC
jgi:hypothetical protein